MIRYLRCALSLLVVVSLTIPFSLSAQIVESVAKPCGCPDSFPGSSMVNHSLDGSAYYLFPYNLHLVSGARSAVPLQLRDASGNVVPGSISFSGYDNSLISISSDGYVTAKRAETATEIGTWVSANINGGSVANTCVVRVLSTNYNLVYASAESPNIILYFPTSINGENISSYVTGYEMAQTLDFAYKVERSLMAVTPFYGSKQIYEVDFGEQEAQRVCGISGNPIRIGWGAGGNTWQNCFLVPFIPPRSPQWGVMFHELGHNMTMISNTFSVGFGITDYVEGLATAIGLECSSTIVDGVDRFPMTSQTRYSIAWVLNRDSTNYLSALQNWVIGGATFSSYTADITDGIWLYYRRGRPADFGQRFFTPLRPAFESIISPYYSAINNSGDNGKHTFFAALVSAAVGRDLSSEFTSAFHFPVVQSLFNSLYPAFTSAIDLAASKAGPAASIAATAGNNQSKMISAPIDHPLIVRVTNSDGYSVSGVSVSFSITGAPAGASGQSLSTATAVTNSDGQASTTLTLGNKGGTYLVTASSAGLVGSPLTFTAIAMNPAPTLFNLSTNRAGKGSRINLSLLGSNLIEGVTTASFGADISVNTLSVPGPAQMNLNISIGANAPIGTRNVTVTNAGPGGGTATLTNAFTVDSSPSTGIEEHPGSLPKNYRLHDAYPNPFNPSTTIRYEIPQAVHVNLKIYSIFGAEVETLVSEFQNAGFYQVSWTPNAPSGVYICRLEAGGINQSCKLTFLK